MWKVWSKANKDFSLKWGELGQVGGKFGASWASWGKFGRVGVSWDKLGTKEITEF